jgi:hypothetical protein
MPVRTSHSTTGHDTSAFMYTYGRFRVVEISAVGREQPFERGPLMMLPTNSGQSDQALVESSKASGATYLIVE